MMLKPRWSLDYLRTAEDKRMIEGAYHNSETRRLVHFCAYAPYESSHGALFFVWHRNGASLVQEATGTAKNLQEAIHKIDEFLGVELLPEEVGG